MLNVVVLAQIVGVVRNSLAVRQSLFAAMPAVDSETMCHPYITEINSRPLNLFYKDNQVGVVGCGTVRMVYCH